jgi:hypothetical protein
VPKGLEAFHKAVPINVLVDSMRGGAFGRGLPEECEPLAQPDITALFRKLLREGGVEGNENESEAVRKFHRNGWLHSHLINHKSAVRYTLPSPLHSACLSWKLQPTNDMPSFTTIFDLPLAVISMFKPSQIHIPIQRAGPLSSPDLQPEARFQDEFYRGLFSITSGNVRISPEFASGR